MSDPYFDQFSASYDDDLHRALSVTGEDKEFFARGRLRWLASHLSQHGRQAGAVLDFGCGTGSATRLIFECLQASRVLGVDVSGASLEAARSEYGSAKASFQLIESPELGAFDVAFCNGVFHHIQPDERQQSLDYIYQSLRPGGVFALFENNPWNPATRYVMSRCAFDKDAITLSPVETRRRMRQAGFQVLTTRFLFIFPAILGALRFLETPLSRLPLGGQYVVVGMKP